jgi:hypothetical protein
MAVLFIYYLIRGDSSRWQVALGGILVSALPILLLFKKNNPFNLPIIVGYYLFIFSSVFLGSIVSFYNNFKWWDSTLHFYKGMYVAFVGITLYKLFIPEQARNGISRWFIFLFVLSLSALVSVLWEIYEFLGDQTFTQTMQRGGNTDTMYDLLYGFVGSLLIAIYFLVKKQKLS